MESTSTPEECGNACGRGCNWTWARAAAAAAQAYPESEADRAAFLRGFYHGRESRGGRAFSVED